MDGGRTTEDQKSIQVRKYDFDQMVKDQALDLSPLAVTTLQVNITKLCNQACFHCHVDASPKRKEQMDRRTAEQVIAVLRANPNIAILDITGGAPELNPSFTYLVEQASALERQVIVRHNLTVTFDGNPQTKETMRHLPEFFAKHRVQIFSSLPYYQEYFTDKQRGHGVFKKSIDSLRLLNAQGYGRDASGLLLNLVYNPIGTFLPAAQSALQADYKKELKAKFDIDFNQLVTITNMPIHRFKDQIVRAGTYDDYMAKLIGAFNPAAAAGIMCRSIISVGYDGRLFDCDFNQMLEMPVRGESGTIFSFDVNELLKRRIKFASHCFGCTAGAGSSCGGATA